MSKSTEQDSSATDLVPPRGRARVVLGVALGFLAVAGSALLLCMLVGRARSDALKRQYARQMGNLAQQLEAHLGYCQERRVADTCSAAQTVYRCSEPVEGRRDSVDPTSLFARTRTGGELYALAIRDLLAGARDGLGRRSGASHKLTQVLLSDEHGQVLEPLNESSTLRVHEFTPLQKVGTSRSATEDDFVIAGESYVAFVEPLEIFFANASPLGKGAKPDAKSQELARQRLVLIGLTPKAEIDAARFEVPPIYFLWAVMLLSMGVLALPVTKLWLIGHKAPFGRSDLALLFVSAILTALLSTTLFLGFLARNRLQLALDNQLSAVSRQLGDELSIRVTESARLLASLSSTGTSVERDHKVLTAQFCPDSVQGPRCNVGDEPPPRFPYCDTKLSDAPRDFRRLYVVDDSGQQRIKYSVSNSSTEFVNLQKRPYFKRVEQHRLDLLPLDGKETLEAAVEVVRSVTTRVFVMIAAKPEYDASGKLTHMIAVESELSDLRKRVLPAGFQALVVRARGDVLLNIGSEADHGDNILRSDDADASLRAQIAARVPGSLDFEYLGTSMRVHVRPIAAGWSMLVMGPSSIVDKLTRQVVVLTLIGFAVLTFAFAWMLMAGWVFRILLIPTEPLPKPRTRLFQPAAIKRVHYAHAGLIGIGAGVSLTVLGLLLAAKAPLLVWLIMPLLLASVLRWALARGVPHERPPRNGASGIFNNLQLAYSTSCLGFVVLLVCAPVGALFGASYDALTELAARAEHSHAARAIRMRQPDIEKQASQAALGTIRFSPQARLPDQGSPSSLSIYGLMDFLRPFDHAAVIGSGRLYQAGSTVDDGRLGRSFSRVGMQLLSAEPGTPSLQSELPRLLSRDYRGFRLLGLCALFALFLMTTVLVLYRSMERLLTLRLLSRDCPPVVHATDLDEISANPQARRLLMLATPALANGLCKQRGWRALPLFCEVDSRLDDADVTWCVADLMALEETALFNLERAYAQARGAIVICSYADWTRHKDPKMRARWAKLFRDQPPPKPYDILPPAGPAQLVTMWSECDEDERRVLGQLSRRGYATPHPGNARTLEHLVARAVLDRHTLTFSTQELQDFVCMQTSSADLARLEASNEPSAWRTVRVPLTTGVAILLMTIGVSQPELAAAGLSIPGLFAILPTVLSRLSGR